MLSHNLKRFAIDGPRVILGRTDNDSAVDDVEFAEGDVFAVDIVMSTGDGKTREATDRATVFKRSVDTSYNLKMKGARERACGAARRARVRALMRATGTRDGATAVGSVAHALQ